MAKAPDYGREVGNLEGKVDMLVQSTAVVGELAGKVTILTKTLYALIALIVPFGAALMWQVLDGKWKLEEKINGLGNRLTAIETTGGAVNDRLTKLEGSEKSFVSTTTETLGRIEGSIAAFTQGQKLTPILLLSLEDAAAIRNGLKAYVDPAIVYNSVGKIGDQVSGTKLAAFPDILTSKYPLLRNMQYVFDQKNQLLIVDADQRVVAIV
jgi:hypothetical protein